MDEVRKAEGNVGEDGKSGTTWESLELDLGKSEKFDYEGKTESLNISLGSGNGGSKFERKRMAHYKGIIVIKQLKW